MLQSLDHQLPDSPLKADVAIVGAGLAGLILATAASERGMSVVVLESGPARQKEGVCPLNRVEQVAQEYLGATEGRFRGLGGTSTRWGGACLPYIPTDFEAHPCGWHDGWGLMGDELEKFLPAIERDLGLEHGTFEGERNLEYLDSFHPRLPKWPVFKNRSIAHVYRARIESDPRIMVWTDATVTDLRLGPTCVSGLVARSQTGVKLEIEAKQIALAAGAIETTRLLLLFNQAHGGRLFPVASPLGKGFHDHLSAPVAKLVTSPSAKLARLFGFRFVTGGMRNLRFELNADARAAKKLPAAFLHVAFNYENDSGFDGLRRVLQATQKGKLPTFIDLIDIGRDPAVVPSRWLEPSLRETSFASPRSTIRIAPCYRTEAQCREYHQLEQQGEGRF